MSEADREYVLGTGSDELARLGFQHRLWSDAAHALWRLVGIRPGYRVLDVGCGPGYASFDLAQFVGPTGQVVGVDESKGFVANVCEQARTRSLPQLKAVVGDVQNLPGAGLELGSFNMAYARWVLCFLPDPAACVAGVAHHLRPGGKFCVHDYFNYETMTLAPRRESYVRVVRATGSSWRKAGGDPDIVGRLPELVRAAGLRVTHLTVHQRIARPWESMWYWADTWWRVFAPKLVAMGELTQGEADEFFRDVDAAAASPDTFLVLPPVYELVAEKP
jgi:ubiquinone/menaquinone biosynthesis C-methylase UbiE